MFDYLGPIGAIESPHGTLEFGNVGTTNCVYFSYKSEADFVPTVMYTPGELADLLRIVELAIKESRSLSQGSVVRLGSMPAKPITLRLALARPNQKEPFLLLRFLQGNWSQNITCAPESLYQLLKMGHVDGPEPLVGKLEREGKAWKVGGERLEVVQGLSPGRGYFGEYVHADDVKEGEELEVWPFSVDSNNLVATFRFRNRHDNDESTHDRPGERADRYLAQGQNHLARAEILKLGEQQLSTGEVTAPWAAKASLTYILAELADGNDEAAQLVWLGKGEDKFLSIGIECMEAGQTSVRDILIYHQISAYFHSLNPEVAEACKGVDHLMKTVCEGWTEKDTRLLPMALSNWYLHLKEVYEGEPPPEALVDWKRAVQKSGCKPRPKVISFPSPDTWDIGEELVSVGPPKPETKPEPKPKPTLNLEALKERLSQATMKQVLQAVVLLLALCLVISKTLAPSRDTPRPRRNPPTSVLAHPASSEGFEGKPALSISGISLDQTWEEIDSTRDWEDQQTTILSSYLDGVYLTSRFDADKNLKYIEGNELSRNGQTLFTKDTELDEVLSRWGEPSQKKESRQPKLTYIYDDAGRKCVLTLIFQDRPGEYDPETGREIKRGPQIDRIKLNLAGDRWKDSPSLPILSK
jgi:hypothetical protein